MNVYKLNCPRNLDKDTEHQWDPRHFQSLHVYLPTRAATVYYHRLVLPIFSFHRKGIIQHVWLLLWKLNCIFLKSTYLYVINGAHLKCLHPLANTTIKIQNISLVPKVSFVVLASFPPISSSFQTTLICFLSLESI